MRSEILPPTSRESDETLRRIAARLILTIHRMVDWQQVDPRSYWERMPAAFRARAQMATSYGQMIEALRKALRLRPWTGEAASEVSSIGRDLANPVSFRRFCRLVREEGALLAAEVRVTLDAMKESKS